MAVLIVAILVALFLVGPLLIVVPMSFSEAASLQFPPTTFGLNNYRHFFADANWTEPLLNSFVIGFATMVLTMVLATPAAFGFMRYRFVGRQVFNVVLMMPLIAPHIVMALAYYIYFTDLSLTQTYTGTILAHTCLSLPIATLIISSGIKGFDRNLERAAMNLGASSVRTFFLVTFPVLRPTFLIAGLFSFVHSFDEAVIALFISGRDAATLPRQMFNSFRMHADPVISAASSLLLYAVLIGVLLPLIVRPFLRSRMAGSSR